MTREEQIEQIMILVPPSPGVLDQARKNLALLNDSQIAQLYDMAQKVAKAGEILSMPAVLSAEPEPAAEEEEGKGIKV